MLDNLLFMPPIKILLYQRLAISFCAELHKLYAESEENECFLDIVPERQGALTATFNKIA